MLLKILFDPLDSSDAASFPKEGTILDDRATGILRRELLSQWLVQMQATEVVGMPCLSALLSDNPAKASEMARSQSNHHLATLISMARDQSGMRRQLLRDQVDIWQGIKAQSLFPKELWLIYQLLAGNIDAVLDELQQHPMNWLLGFALFFWYSSGRGTSIADTFKRFWASQGGRLRDSEDPVLGLLFLHSFGHANMESMTIKTIDPLHWVILTLLNHFKDCQIRVRE